MVRNHLAKFYGHRRCESGDINGFRLPHDPEIPHDRRGE